MGTVTMDGVATDRDAWLSRRIGGIGASETPIVLGLTGSRLKLYMQKTGHLDRDEPSEAMAWGLRLEDDIVDAYQERTGLAIAATQLFHAHPDIPYMIATLDAVTRCGRVVEFKSVGLYGPGRELGDDGDSGTLPASWIVQVNQQLAIAEAAGIAGGDEADIAVFGPGLRLRVYPVRRSDALIEMAAGAIRRFMEEHVIPGVPPEDLEPEDAAHVARLFRGETGELVDLDAAALESAARYQELGAEIRALQDERDRLKAALLLAIGNASGATLPGGWGLARKVVAVKEHVVKASTQVGLTVKGPRS